MTMTADTPETTLKDGRVVAIAGPVVDVEFPPDALPEINLALQMEAELEGNTITTEIMEIVSGSEALRQGEAETDYLSDTIEGRDADLFAARGAER